PHAARYHLRGTLHAGGSRLTASLIEAPSGRLIWAGAFEACASAFEQRAAAIVRAVEPALLVAEVERATCARDPTGWDLTMRPLPLATSAEPSGADKALVLLEQAMALSPHDPLPLAIAAWCHGLRAGHHFVARPAVERAAARALAERAARLNAGDALAETML